MFISPESWGYISYNCKDNHDTRNIDISIKTEKKMAEGVLLTNTDSSLNLKTWDSGAYVILVRGGNIEHKKIFYLYSPQDKRPPIQTYNWLVQEKTSCKPGENAEILFGSSAKNVYVLYELYDGYQLLKREFLQLSDQVKHFSLSLIHI